MANSGWPEEDVYGALLDQGNVGGRFLQRMHMANRGRARSWLARQYGDARRWVTQNPAGDPQADAYRLSVLIEALEQGQGISSGQAGVTERSVLRYLIGEGLRAGTVIVRAGHRTISENTCASLATVHRVLGRLLNAGWLELYEPSRAYQAASYRLTMPNAGSLITEVPLFMGGKDTPVRNLPASVDRLFAAQGVGRGARETFAQLPFLTRRIGRLVGVAVDRGVPAVVKQLSPPDGARRLPKAPPGLGRTPEEVARASGKSVETARRHLRRLEQAHMAFRDPKGRWYRYYFDPQELAVHLQLPDTPALLQDRYGRDRDGYYEFLSTPRGKAIHGVSIVKAVNDEEILYFEERTGNVVHRTRLQPTSATGIA